jgi:hypothetical protein
MSMARAAEYSLYVLVAFAFLPLTLLEGHALAYYLMNPGMLQVRDAALESPGALVAAYALCLLVPAAAVAVYVLAVASRSARMRAAILLGALCATLSSSYLAAQFPLNTWGRLCLEGVPALLFLALTVALLLVRLFSSTKASRAAVNRLG